MNRHSLAFLLSMTLMAGSSAAHAAEPDLSPGGPLTALAHLWPVRPIAFSSWDDQPLYCCQIWGIRDSDVLLILPGEDGPESVHLASFSRRTSPKDLRFGVEQGIFYLTTGGQRYNACQLAEKQTLYWSYHPLLQQDGYVLETSTILASSRKIPWSPTDLYRLTLPNGDTRWLTTETNDQPFCIMLDNYPNIDEERGPTWTLSVDWDPETLTAVLSNTKLTFTLDFARGTTGLQRTYTPELIQEAMLYDSSPSGEKSLYLMDSGGMGDSFWGDLVLYADGEYRYCCPDVGGAVFLEEEKFAVSGVFDPTITLYDTETLEQLPPLPGLEFEEILIDGQAWPSRRVLGWTYDDENGLFLVATREEPESYDSSYLCPATLLVLNSQGELLRELDAGFSVYQFYKNYPEQCSVTCQDGTASIISRSVPQKHRGSVVYLER